MTDAIQLRGMGWAHVRAMGPLHVTAEAFSDLHPGARITWETRSLSAFGEDALDEIAGTHDLIVLDHPMVGYATERRLLIPLDEHLGDAWMREQEQHAVGRSHASYQREGHQWAAAIDAACPVAASRDDLLNDIGRGRPGSWGAMIELARETGRVRLPLKQIDALSLFFGLCSNQGEDPLDLSRGNIVSREVGRHVLGQLTEVRDAVGVRSLDQSPIDVLTEMTSSDRVLHCPHLYGYSNYAREGYADRRVRFHEFCGPGEPPYAGTTLGGAGLAVSSATRHVAHAVAYLAWVSSPVCQRTTYMLAGGQPGLSSAWDDGIANELTAGFFRDTRSTIDSAFVRPNHPGMHDFQATAGGALRRYLYGELMADDCLRAMNAAFALSVASRSGV